MKTLLKVLLGLSLCASAMGQELLSPPMHLRKIKMSLMGQDPSPEEYLDFIMRYGLTEGLLRMKIREYLSSEAFSEKSFEFVEELLLLRPRIYSYERTRPNDMLSNLAFDIFRHDLSWDTFFTASSFMVRPRSSLVYYDDNNYEQDYFTAHMLPEQEEAIFGEEPFSVTVQDESLAAGFMLSRRFRDHYFNNPANKGRKRAAAVIRIGLCRSMIPDVEIGIDHERLEDLLARGGGLFQAASQVNPEGDHARKEDCRNCHIRGGLDPLAQTFKATEVILDRIPSPGRFTYITDEGEFFDRPVEGIGDWARVLITRPEYESCQVRNFWRYFAGDTIDLDRNPELMEDIIREWNSADRRVSALIEAILMSRPFRLDRRAVSESTESSADEIQEVIRRCTSCHLPGNVAPDFLRLPIRDEDGEDQTRLYARLILERLALGPYGDRRPTMPPASSSWRPNEEERTAILRWIEDGLPDAEGVRHLSEEDITAILYGEELR